MVGQAVGFFRTEHVFTGSSKLHFRTGARTCDHFQCGVELKEFYSYYIGLICLIVANDFSRIKSAIQASNEFNFIILPFWLLVNIMTSAKNVDGSDSW